MQNETSHKTLILKLLSDEVSILNNPYRYGSQKYGEVLREARAMYLDGEIHELDIDTLYTLESEAGELAMFEGAEVMLEIPQMVWGADAQDGVMFVFVRENGIVSRVQL